MKILSYELQDFGSHRHTRYEPGDARLCVIVGPNGVGKSTLVSEALGYALFKDARGSVDGPVRNGATDSAVTIEFAFNGATYRAIRRRTTKAGGKSSADLQVRRPDGGWTPVASGDKEVPAAVRELLRMDAATFRTSVSLAQRDLDRFVAATASGRKEVLAAIVVDPRFRPAADLAGRRARELEASVASDRSYLTRTSDAIAELEPVGAARDRALLEATRLDAVLDEQASARKAAEALLEALTTRQAAAAAQAADVGRIRDEIVALANRHASTSARRETSTTAIAVAEATLAGEGAVAIALEQLPDYRRQVAELAAGEAEDRKLAGEIATASAALEEIDRPIREAVTTWRTKRAALEARIRELEEHARNGTSTCALCGQAITEATALEQLQTARRHFTELGDEPKAPLALARASAAMSRLESRRRALDWHPEILVDVRAQLAAVERVAADAGLMAAARATLEREQAAVAAAELELEEITTTGKAARARLDELTAAAAARDELAAQVGAARDELARIVAAWERADAERRDVDRRIAQHEAALERLDGLHAEREKVDARIQGGAIAIERLRKLAAAFGLKGIPARVIEGVLPELEAGANEVLGELFAMRLEIRATRASADGKSEIDALHLVVRKDDAGEIELERTSGGEGTAIALALAIGLSRLNARRAGTAIRSLVIDEPDGLDTAHVRALGAYLRELVHHGQLDRIFVISHTETLGEFGDQVAELRPGADGPELWIDGMRAEPRARQDIAA